MNPYDREKENIGVPTTNELLDSLRTNIRLDYQLVINCAVGEDEVSYYCRDGAEFFCDEHGLQWVKFIPANGYHHGKEHMMRTDCAGFMVIRDDRPAV